MKNIQLGFLILAITGSLLLSSSQALAAMGGSGSDNVLFGLSLLKFDRETEGPTLGTSTEKWTIYDLKLGYVFSNNFYLGVIYSGYSDDNGSNTNTRGLLGGTVGYHNDGWFIDGSYLLSGQLKLSGSTLKDPSGYSIDFGYNAMMGSNFYLGVEASYKSISYDKKDNVSETNKEKSELYPMLSAGVLF